ncbi:MAG: hypothetical protein AB1813_27450 [Verrucomicrobiota bacterium]
MAEQPGSLSGHFRYCQRISHVPLAAQFHWMGEPVIARMNDLLHQFARVGINTTPVILPKSGALVNQAGT